MVEEREPTSLLVTAGEGERGRERERERERDLSKVANSVGRRRGGRRTKFLESRVRSGGGRYKL